jgi:hypothetical protein
MSYFFARSIASSSVKLALILTLPVAAACAARTAPPPAAPPPVEALDDAPRGSGVAEQQPPGGEDFVFVAKERKTAAPEDGDPPATSLHADQSARKQRVAPQTVQP